MADLAKTLKGAWIKGMEAIGTAANNIASNTKYKMDEMNIINRRREILSDFGAKAYDLWQKGTRFPEQLEAQLQELSELDVRLNELRMQKLSNVPADDAEKTTGTSEPDVPSIIVKEQRSFTDMQEQTSVNEKATDAIDALFSEKTVTAEMPAKVNDAIDDLGDGLQEFSKQLGVQIEQLNEKLNAD